MRLDKTLLAALGERAERDHVSRSESIREAIRAYVGWRSTPPLDGTASLPLMPSMPPNTRSSSATSTMTAARQLHLGSDATGRLLEVVVLRFDSGNELLIHAMKTRRQYPALLGRRPRRRPWRRDQPPGARDRDPGRAAAA